MKNYQTLVVIFGVIEYPSSVFKLYSLFQAIGFLFRKFEIGYISPISAMAVLLAGLGLPVWAQQDLERQAQKTEVWEPEPAVVAAPADAPPSDAIVLFAGGDLEQWESVKGGAADWTVSNGVLTVKPGSGDIKTKVSFCDLQLHLEWKVPQPDAGMKGQQRNNSGVFLQQRYEIQVLDSYRNRTYSNGQAGALYKQAIPLVNAMRAPGQWQYYDILFTAPRFAGDKLASPGYVTVFHNGVVVQNHTEIQGSTAWIGAPEYSSHECAPLQLQDHGNLVSFRNIWVRTLKSFVPTQRDGAPTTREIGAVVYVGQGL